MTGDSRSLSGYRISLPVGAALIGVVCAVSGFGATEGSIILVTLALAAALLGVRVALGERIEISTSWYAYIGFAVFLVVLLSVSLSAGAILIKLFGSDLGFDALGLFFCFAVLVLAGASVNSESIAVFFYVFEGMIAVRALYELWLVSMQPIAGEYPMALVILLVICAIQALVATIAAHRPSARSWHAAIALICCAGVAMTVFAYRAQEWPTTASFSNTEQVLAFQDLSSLHYALIGPGPGSFGDSWNKYRSYDLNLTPFWKEPPPVAYDMLGQFAITTGLVGLAALLLVPASLFYLLYRERSRALFSREPLFAPLFVMVVACAAIMFIAPIDSSVFLLFGFSAGACIGSLEVTRLSGIQFLRSNRPAVAISLFVAGVAMIIVAWLQYTALRADQAGVAILGKNPTTASVDLQKAVQLWPAPEYLKDAAQSLMAQAVQEAQTQITNNSVNGPGLIALVDQAEQFSTKSVGPTGDPSDADMWIARASVYLSAASLSVQGTEQIAQQALIQAKTLAPARPDVYYDEAVLALFNGDTGLARAYLTQALELKPDYQGAQDLLATLGS